MNKSTLCFLFLLATRLVAAAPAVLLDRLPSELRPVLGDAQQLRRTSSLNWPFPSAHAASGLEPLPTPPEQVLRALPPEKIRVVLDAGHGGHDVGAQIGHSIREKEICLRIAKMTQSRLERLAKLQDVPMEITLSRSDDHFVPLRERARLANDWGADLFVSVHANSSPVQRARGFEVYFLSNEATDAEASRVARKENQEPMQPLSAGILSILSDLQTNAHILESSRFAEVVYASLAERARPNGRGVRQAPFTVLAGTQMPALLVEVGYLTNPEEAQWLTRATYQNKLASGIAEGILNAAMRRRKPRSLPSWAPAGSGPSTALLK